jgi:hypothetical protein
LFNRSYTSESLFLFEFEKAVINGTVDMVEKNEAEDDEKLKIKLADGLLGPGHY